MYCLNIVSCCSSSLLVRDRKIISYLSTELPDPTLIPNDLFVSNYESKKPVVSVPVFEPIIGSSSIGIISKCPSSD